MIQITDAKTCCGCTACKSICPKEAISMEPDALGFLYPHVNKDLCINCGMCEKICSFNENYDKSKNFDEPIAYGARHKDLSEVETSRSGAAFIALSDWIINHNGAVYGAGYTDFFRVIHKRATTKEERNEFKGSKYVQSDIGETFKQVKTDLQDDKFVLYSGTACQIAGLKSYIPQKLHEKLFLVDIVCHGVPSPYIWKDYLKKAEQTYGPITSVSFRDKSKLGWKAHKESLTFQNGQTRIFEKYTDLFFQHVMLRQSCAVCHFANLKHPSDITIADFWGWEKTDGNINKDDKGISLLLVNTPKGSNLLENSRDDLIIFPADLEKCLQPNLLRPSPMHPKRKQFEKDYLEKGYTYVSHRYSNEFILTKAKRFLRRNLGRLKFNITKFFKN